jgi:predicted  nucleic acid-binding Zn-ribbon protein
MSSKIYYTYLINYLQAIIKEQLKMYKEYNEALLECFNCNTDNVEVKFELELLQQTFITVKNNVEELNDKFETTKKLLEHHDEEFQPLKREAERLYNEALILTDNLSPQDDAFKSFNKAFEKLPATIPEINNELNTAQAKVFCMAKNIDAEDVSMA